MKKSLIPLAAIILVLVATSAGVLALTGGDSTPARSDEGIEALQVDGVWVFQHQPAGGNDALHSGTPEIVDGCLVIDNTIVVWPDDRIDEATEAIAAVKAGESPQLLIGGGGISLDEGARPDQFPTAITDRCQTTAVWFVAGDMPPILSSEGIDPDECNLIHNITACDQDEFDRLGEDSSLPVNSDKDGSCEPLPLRSDCGIDPDECNQVHNIDACGEVLNPPDPFDEPAGEGGDYFQVTIRFNTSYAEEDIDAVDAFLRTFDDDFEFIILEILPPIGSALLTLETSDECWTIEAQLEAKSYVSDITCAPWQPVDLDDPDAPVTIQPIAE